MVKTTDDASRPRPIWRMVAHWAANSVPAGTPSRAGKGEKKLRRTLLAVNDGRQCREVLEGIGEGRVLRAGEHGEPEAAAGHQMRPASDLALPPDHGTPDDLGGEAQRPAGWEEVEGAGEARPEQVEVLDLRAREA
jgi:hypothetical protein